MDVVKGKSAIEAGDTALGIELGSTRIKAVLVDTACHTLATAGFAWENQLEDGIWTYDMELAWQGVQTCYRLLAEKVGTQFHVPLRRLGAIGISGMMHGYLPFDAEGRQLVPFRSWRNNRTGMAADALTERLSFHIPQRWSVAHLYQSILDGEAHVGEIAFLTTLAGYIHWRLSGEKVLGIDDASGMFPIDETTGSYDAEKLASFSSLVADKGYGWDIAEILPRVLKAGECAGHLTPEGARLLDPSGGLAPGALMAPPEGDAGTGMVSTDSVRRRTGNISVGTSAFSMNVLDAPLKKVHRDIDIVMTPDGSPVAMVHTSNCTSDLNAWIGLFREFAERAGLGLAEADLYRVLFQAASKGMRDAGGLISYGCLSGENITGIEKGRPLFVRTPESRMTLADFMRTQLYGAFAPLKIGMDILREQEGIETDAMIAQGGLFQTPVVAQQILADALDIPITAMETAGEGGPWGMAVLAVFAKWYAGEKLADFLDEQVFLGAERETLTPTEDGVAGYGRYIERYKKVLSVEREAGRVMD